MFFHVFFFVWQDRIRIFFRNGSFKLPVDPCFPTALVVVLEFVLRRFRLQGWICSNRVFNLGYVLKPYRSSAAFFFHRSVPFRFMYSHLIFLKKTRKNLEHLQFSKFALLFVEVQHVFVATRKWRGGGGVSIIVLRSRNYWSTVCSRLSTLVLAVMHVDLHLPGDNLACFLALLCSVNAFAEHWNCDASICHLCSWLLRH